MSEPTRPDSAYGPARPTVPDALGPFGRRPRGDSGRGSDGADSARDSGLADSGRGNSGRGNSGRGNSGRGNSGRGDSGRPEAAAPTEYLGRPGTAHRLEESDPADGGRESGAPESLGESPLGPIARRAGARLIDTGLLAVAGFAVIMPILVAGLGLDRPGSAANDPNASGAWSGPAVLGWVVVLAVLPFLYEAVQLAIWGQTVGKRVLGLQVVAADPFGARLTTGQAVSRAAVSNVVYLFGCGIGTVLAYLWAIWDEPLHQSVHDKVAGTVVIDARAEHEET
jgi:uncharacterized RDD family membrane protein YckC